MPTSAIETAVKRAKGQTALAKAIGVSQGLVWQWLRQGTPIHTKYFARIEKATGVSSAALLADELAKARRASRAAA